MARRFAVMSTIVPPTRPAAGSGAPASPSVSSVGSAGAEASAATAGTGAAAPPSAAAAGAQASTPSETARVVFDEAMGRSRGTAPLGTPVEPGGMQCSNEVCKPLAELSPEAAAMGVTISLCCTDAGECGTMGSGPMSMGDPMKCRLIPDSDPQCARLELMGFEIASCCTADGRCGLNGEAFDRDPCGSIESAMEMFGGFIELPPPAACSPGMGPPLSSSAPAPGSEGSKSTGMPAAGSTAMPTAGATAGAAAMPTAGSAAP